MAELPPKTRHESGLAAVPMITAPEEGQMLVTSTLYLARLVSFEMYALVFRLQREAKARANTTAIIIGQTPGHTY